MKNCYCCDLCGAIFKNSDTCLEHEKKHAIPYDDIEFCNYRKDGVYPEKITIHFKNNARMIYGLLDYSKQQFIY